MQGVRVHSRLTMSNSTKGNAAGRGGIWVIAEHADGEVAEVTFELLCEARKLASKLGPVSVVLAGPEASPWDPKLGQYGADKAFVIAWESLEAASARSVAHLFANLIQTHKPGLVLFPSTSFGSEVAAIVSASLSFPLVTNCVGIGVNDEGQVLATKPGYGGKVYRTYASSPGTSQLVTIRPGIIGLDRPDGSRRIELVEIPYEMPIGTVPAVRLLKVVEPDPSTLDLTEAPVVVAGGRGVGCRENLRLLEELAEVLGGVVGGTRAAVDAGWLPFSRQIGQTGKYIAPRLYIACGISGAVHHMAGVQDSKLIVAINNDRNAPIFKIADVGVVGDLLEVIPAMIAEIKESRARVHQRSMAAGG